MLSKNHLKQKKIWFAFSSRSLQLQIIGHTRKLHAHCAPLVLQNISSILHRSPLDRAVHVESHRASTHRRPSFIMQQELAINNNKTKINGAKFCIEETGKPHSPQKPFADAHSEYY